MRTLRSLAIVALFTIGCGVLFTAACREAPASGTPGSITAPAPSRSPVPAVDESLARVPRKAGSLRFVVIGDAGRGSRPQYDIAAQMEGWRKVLPYDFVLMAGDNVYDGGTPEDYRLKFELPYKPLLDAGVRFYGALGNHDASNQVRYEPLNMNGNRYYTFEKRQGLVGTTHVRFFVLDTVRLDYSQLRWLDRELGASDADWKIALFHHPIYTSGRYQSNAAGLRRRLEPIFARHGLDVAFSGHEHFYERTLPQHGVTYFVSGAGGSLRPGDISPAASGGRRAVGFDRDNHFLLIEIAGDEFYFQAITRTGETIDAGVVHRDRPGPTIR